MPGAQMPPVDELDSAETTLAVLQQVLQGIGEADLTKQTPCTEFDVAALTDHLMNSITSIGAAAGAAFPDRDRSEPVERQVTRAARPALDAWKRRGLGGTVSFGSNETSAPLFLSILSIEFLVHAWDYACATARQIEVPDELSCYVLGLAGKIISPEGRKDVGFADPAETAGEAGVFDRLIAFTGRTPVG